jgi:hypothetical protein
MTGSIRPSFRSIPTSPGETSLFTYDAKQEAVKTRFASKLKATQLYSPDLSTPLEADD